MGNYNTVYEYDKNGNLLTLSREGRLGGSSSYALIDELVYTYTGNQLESVNDIDDSNHQNNGFSDDGSFASTEYAYDENGNMFIDANKNMQVYEYNYLNLPQQLNIYTGGTNEINYLYDAAGIKLRKQTKIDYSVENTTDYIGNFVYENNDLKYILTNEGRVMVNTGSTYEYQYFLKDHLDNTRVTFNQIGEVIQEDSYYPFGMAMNGLNYETGLDYKNKYLYNGKELQDEFGLEWYDYGARFYDAQLGRWHVVDAMTENHFETNPYHYCFNNPILFIDPIGLDTFNIYLSNHSIDRITVKDSENHVFNIDNGETTTTHTLEINDEGLVEFPETGEGFGRYGTEDEGGDHYLKPEATAALFGLTSEMKEEDGDFQVDFGDMSDEDGGAPSGDHKMHGGTKGYSGVCVDYRYLDKNNQSYWGNSTNSKFSSTNNYLFLQKAKKWGFTKNYISNKKVWIRKANVKMNPNGKQIGGHDNHGHLTHIK